MIALYILLGLVLLVFLLLIIPVRFKVKFEEEFTVIVSYLFFKKLLDFSEDEKLDEKPKPLKEATGDSALEKLKRIFKRKGFTGFLQSFYEILRLVLQAGGQIVKRIKLSSFDLYLCVGGAEDPADAAETYGKLCAGVYPACAELFAITGAPRRKKPKKAVSVDLDYTAAENTVCCSAQLSVKPITVLNQALRLLWRVRPTLLDLLRASKAPVRSKQNPSQKKGESA